MCSTITEGGLILYNSFSDTRCSKHRKNDDMAELRKKANDIKQPKKIMIN